MALGPHLGGEIGVVLVEIVVSAVGEKSHGLHWEGEDVAAALLVEPVHEMLLQPVERLPLRCAAVREAKIPEHTLKIVAVEIADVPEHGLVAPVAGRHVHRMHDLLEIVVYHLDERALLGVELHDLIKTGEVVIPVVLADEIIEVHQELRRGHGPHELGGDRIDEVDELAAERLEVRRSDGDSPEFAQTAHEERIHRNGNAVREARSTALVMFVKYVRIEILEVLVRKGPPVEGLYLVTHYIAVLLDVVLLVELVAEGHDVLAGDICVGVELGPRRRIGGGDIILDKITLAAQIHVGIEFLDIGKGHLLVDGHERLLHLTADFSTRNALIDIEVVYDGDNYGIIAVLLG